MFLYFSLGDKLTALGTVKTALATPAAAAAAALSLLTVLLIQQKAS